MSVYEIVKNARSEKRVRTKEIIENIFEDIIYLKGDRNFGDSHSIIGGIGSFENTPITFIGIEKGNGIEDSLKRNFGMPMPEGYRKSMRLMRQAEKFRRPIITFVDTPGAYPGIDAEERGQFEAIASSLKLMSSLTVPVIAFVIGEGGSGGALALSVANKIYMFENAIYSILSPEGFASILWKNSNLADKAAEVMKITSKDLYEFGIVDEIVRERNNLPDYMQIKKLIAEELSRTNFMTAESLQEERYEKFRKIGR
ncbi:acetyl-CoA carboxylase carboxyl transferase subunit alpha [Peptoniphilus asaccharolyticus DSM 20463]|uniref:acetyl-CoA carboxytransferase n=1 Tax=Peptoniphilus asaccharolyticus DSM 20463 TaxID=573058 RepID=A0A1W1UYF8_PEPAS|nr:carboxyltransferase subunit alpha [Peptoniphilus asaccharolyticus]MBL7575310.1 acetyl-CoA carboxylase carboxyl transferase subunit alpha [Peptoniphilus asaccharolyticus]SMB85774.1 acetyl-CoA carboxylase carboxyl transferase subunit alpha [Peptoniphilus asaccharolyticus DSM 20463]